MDELQQEKGLEIRQTSLHLAFLGGNKEINKVRELEKGWAVLDFTESNTSGEA